MPCALVLSVPLSYSRASEAPAGGVLVKGASYLGLNDVGTVVFDKTGTLTQGPSPLWGGGQQWLHRARRDGPGAHAGSQSNHPLSASIRKAPNCKHVLDTGRVQHVQEYPVWESAPLDGKPVIAGNDRLLHRESVTHGACV